MTSLQQQEYSVNGLESLDADGAGNHDQPYRFGWRPRVTVPHPFNTRQYGRLLVLRGRVRDDPAGNGVDDELGPAA